MPVKKVVLSLSAIFLMAALVFLAISATRAENGTSFESTVTTKLEEIVKNQKTILQNLSSIQEQLEVIKIRITQNQ